MLDGTVFGEFADLYYQCRRAGLANPRDVDELELWEVAAVLGSHRPEDAKPTIQQPARGGGPDAESLRLIEARAKHRRGEGPKPEAPAYPPEMFGLPPGSVTAMMETRRGDY